MKLGVLGGTFDPPHLGHLLVAQEVHHRLSLDRVLWIPAATPPHKKDREVTPGELRLEMVHAAIAGDDRFEASDVELRRGGLSYTVDTLRALRGLRGSDGPGGEPSASHAASPELYLILGSDQLRELDTWREPDEVKRLATLVGFARAGEEAPAMEGAEVVEVPRIDISSTEVRRRVGAGEPIGYMVPGGVEAVIRREGLYGAS
jgi:nicotinate-nucleotide adenylyltransferase